jgi:fructose-specific phosphotransferase system IIC component
MFQADTRKSIWWAWLVSGIGGAVGGSIALNACCNDDLVMSGSPLLALCFSGFIPGFFIGVIAGFIVGLIVDFFQPDIPSGLKFIIYLLAGVIIGGVIIWVYYYYDRLRYG